MKQQEVLKKIGGIIKELNDQYKYLEETAEDLNDLELELFIANAHFLTDHAGILRKLNLQRIDFDQRIEKKQEKPDREIFFEPVVQQKDSEVKNTPDIDETEKAEPLNEAVTGNNTNVDKPVPHMDLQSGSNEDTYSFIRQEPETIRHELIIDDADSWDDEDELDVYHNEEITEPDEKEIEAPVDVKPTVTVDKTDNITPAVEAPQTNNHKDTEEKVLTINQKISADLSEQKKGITEQLGAQAITDLKTAINLNDKLLYVKELFNGYSLAYSEAIEILNRFKTFEEANNFLNVNYVVKNNWASKPETTNKFYALLKRRYS